ncbi:ABC transporter ATP-binding protein [Spiroplasma gladiatoris]|uniref:ABC transporter ATP-binding protein n=1 Tax=Spiroplasma gladiatoris TaxID=2143 RepID=A0A4P7AI50_9MOLU|nr:ABC transporter ATP-binding protein/permease [Spiroplasma gladiatoris]QBQ08145.1 ABC transporter ATP-binding protein [Spiroplasma gladiatoris]
MAIQKRQWQTKPKQKTIAGLFMQGCKQKPIIAFFALIFIIAVIGFTVLNIKIAESIVKILTAQNLIDMISNKDGSLHDIFKDLIEQGYLTETPNAGFDVDKLLENEELVNKILKKLGNDDVLYKAHKVYVDLFGFGFSFNDWIIVLICNIGLIVLTMYLSYFFTGIIAQTKESDLRRDTITKIISQDLNFFHENKTQGLVSLVVKDIGFIGEQLKIAPIIILYIIGSFVGATVTLGIIDWKITLCTLSLLVAVVLISLLVVFLISKPTKKISNKEKDLNNKMAERIQAIRLVKSAATWNEEQDYFKNETKKLDLDKKLSLALTTIIAALLVGGIGSFTMASIVFGSFIYTGETAKLLTIFSTFTAGIFVVITPLFQLKEILEGVNRAKNSFNVIDKITSIVPKIDVNKEKEIETINGDVILNNITFSYPDDPEKIIINNLNLVLRKNKKYAFVGPSGSGKSTIAKLLLRFYDPTDGSILVNGNTDLSELNLKSWLKHVGYVDQEPQIFSGTIIENISYGLEDFTMEDLISACKKAKLHSLIMSMPKGYETVLYERGSQLSGGQKQRLVIARAFLKNPKILILDEATSALDNIVEKEIQEELDKLMIGRTTISIAHRLSTIKDFDEIFVLDPKVGISQRGTFQELIKINGMFKTLYETSN